jgi:hypothetical protein
VTNSLRKLIFLAPRLAALLATSYLLIATSSPTDCENAEESITFHVSGTCGPEGDIVVSSGYDQCAIIVQGAGAVNLPWAGHFEGGKVSLSKNAWTLSGYLPETAIPDAGLSQPDAGISTVVRDAQDDLGGISINPDSDGQGNAVDQHATPMLRTCAFRPMDAKPATLTCTGGGIATCAAILTQLSASPVPARSADEGCSCRLSGQGRIGGWLWVVGLAAALGLFRRRSIAVTCQRPSPTGNRPDTIGTSVRNTTET